MDVLGIGSAFVDYFFEADSAFLNKFGIQPEDDILYDEEGKFNEVKSSRELLSKSAGGSTPNTLHILSSLGKSVAYYGITGHDKETQFWEGQLERINLSHTIKKGSISKCACILTNNRHERTFTSYMNEYDNAFFNTCDTNILNYPKFLHIAQFFQNPTESFKKLLMLVEKIHNPLISFSPGTVYALEGIEKLSSIFLKTHVLFLNANEIKILTQKAPKEGSVELIQYGPQIIVCTLGEKGALITTRNMSVLIPGVVNKSIIDTTSAGDSFAGAFLYGLLEKWDIKKCGEFANKVASLSTNGYGCVWMKESDIRSVL